MKILNLYAGIGGNRKLWPSEHEITAVEIKPEIAGLYQSIFPDDTVVVGDAHQYLLNHYKDYDFIWSSPPCQTHSRTAYFLNPQGIVRYPDMSLYQEILFLQSFSKCPFVVENVISYYKPLIEPQGAGRHYFWANFIIPAKEGKIKIGKCHGDNQHRIRGRRLERLGFGSEIKEKMLRNCVDPQLGLYVLNCAFKNKQEVLAIY
jgi:DNA (cytosine-5)-methyltransferase 1